MALNIKPFYPIEHPDLSYDVKMDDYHKIETDSKNDIEYHKKQSGRNRLRKKEDRGKKDLIEMLLERLHII